MNIAIIILDSCRADRLFNRDVRIFRFLRRFKRDAIFFRNAYTTAPWTLPSHTTLFTGLYASEHGLQSGFEGANLRLSTHISTLPELLKDMGYSTGGFCSNPWIGRSSGLNRGFDLFVEYDFEVTRGTPSGGLLSGLSRFHRGVRRVMGERRLPIIRRPYVSKTMVNGAMKWIYGQRNEPWFLFLNLMDPHNPYQPPKRFIRQVAGNSGNFLHRKAFNRMLDEYLRGDRPPDDVLLENTNVYYNASLAHADFQIGRLVSFLKQRGLLENTLLFILSDHGKTLGEYNRKTFPLHYITDLNIHIPLLFFDPGHNAAEVDHPASLIDIHYTILHRLGLRAGLNNNLMRPTLEDRMKEPSGRYVFSEVWLPYCGKYVQDPDEVQLVTNGRYKLLISKKLGEILIDRTQDTEERTNFAVQQPQRVHKLKEELDIWRDGMVIQQGASDQFGVEDMDQEVRAHLEGLGYL